MFSETAFYINGMLNIMTLDDNLNHDSTEYACYILLKILRKMQQKYCFIILIDDVPLCWNSRVKQHGLKLPSKHKKSV